MFESGQHPIIVGQGAYNSAYGTSFQSNGPNAGLVQIFDNSFTFKTLAEGAGADPLTFDLQPKMIQDEMGEAFDADVRAHERHAGRRSTERPGRPAEHDPVPVHVPAEPISSRVSW